MRRKEPRREQAAQPLMADKPKCVEQEGSCASDDAASNRQPHAYVAVQIVERLQVHGLQVSQVQGYTPRSGLWRESRCGQAFVAAVGANSKNRFAHSFAPSADITAPPTLSQPALPVSMTTATVNTNTSTGSHRARRSAGQMAPGPRVITVSRRGACMAGSIAHQRKRGPEGSAAHTGLCQSQHCMDPGAPPSAPFSGAGAASHQTAG